MYHNIEAKIRDWLSENLNFIEKGLKLIGKEYFLPDRSSISGGYIDILATDMYNNFVIIEIKRTDTSARETCTEILKYHFLIKQIFNAKDSEIRIVIISTHWNQIVYAFSELIDRTTYAIKGYEITTNPITNEPESIIEKQFLSNNSIQRKFSEIYPLVIFETEKERNYFKQIIREKLNKVKIPNYICLYLDSTGKSKNIIYPYSLFIIFQKLSEDQMSLVIEKLNGENSHSESYLDSKDDYLIYLLCRDIPFDEIETGYAEKLDAMLTSESWTVSNITKYGLFNNDPRFDDELLLREVRGLDGNNNERYFGIGESTQLERIKELKDASKYCLANNNTWLEFISCRVEKILSNKERVRVGIYIYNPNSPLENLAISLIKNDVSYLPFFYLFIDDIDKQFTEIYQGSLVWNGKVNDYSLFGRERRGFNILLNIHFGTDDEELKLLLANMYFSINRTIIDNNITTEALIQMDEDENKIIIDSREQKSIFDYYKKRPKFLQELVSVYKSYTNF